MKFLIEIGGATQPDLIRALDEARKQLVGGGCHLNVGGCVDVKLCPATTADAEEFYRQYQEAHPKATAYWSK